MEIRIGTAGWNIPGELAGRFPQTGTHLQRYAQRLLCVEINSSFHRAHRLVTWEKWANSVPETFRFSVKAPRTITHDALLNCDRRLLKAFINQLQPLGAKLGPILFQLPPSLGFNQGSAEAFFSMVSDLGVGHVVCEPRHPSWFTDEAADLLRRFRIARVTADPAVVPQAADPRGWRGLTYFRLHGSPRRYYSSYSQEFLETIATRLAILRERSEVWCIFDNTASGAAMENALELQRLTSRGAV